MKNLLFLVHRLPYPPNKGDKISSFNLLRYFSSRYHVYLATFIDDPEDRQYIPAVEALCAGACFVDLDPFRAKIASLRGLLTGEALTLPYYRSKRLQTWVDDTIRAHPPDAVLVYSGAMGQYVNHGLPAHTRTVFEMEDVDSDKWRSYSETKSWPLSWLYRRESRRLFAFERANAGYFDVSLFISKAEAALFQRLAPEVADRVTYRTQGVDSDFFDPSILLENPYPANARPLVFCGAMDYWPNVDAVVWFVEESLPLIREQMPDVTFTIVGMNPADDVLRLAEKPGVFVTGGVPDVRPYVAHAAAAVLPLRIARGIQNKVLEAMALERPVLATPSAMAGIEPCPESNPRVAETAEDLARAAIDLLQSGLLRDPGGRLCVQRHYNWDANLRRIGRLLDSGSVEASLGDDP